MTDPAAPPLEDPDFDPIGEAFDQAEQRRDQAQAEAAERAREAEKTREREKTRKEDARSIRRAHKEGGMSKAKKVGRAYGWTSEEVEDLIDPPPPPREPPADGDDGGGDRPPPPAPPSGDDDGPVFKLKKNPIKPLPGNCPVECLGTQGVDLCFYLTPAKEFVALDSHAAERIRLLFASRGEWLWSFLPKFSAQTGEQTGWDAARTSESLIEACGKLGPFDPAEKLRGAGAWRGDDGELLWHCGDQLWTGAAWRAPGKLGTFVYPGQPALPHPAERGDDDAARKAFRLMLKGEIDAFLTLLDSWQWAAEFDFDPQTGEPLKINGHRLCSLLVLGWICTALVGGALDWRPMIWLTGDAATGKSTLQKLIAMVMGASLVSSSDATAAGIYQSVGYSSRAAGIDEAENDPFSTKMKGMVELVRQSSSGGQILRGSNDPKKWRGFTARSSFLLSSIVIPPLFGQDLTRITILPLNALPRDAKKPKLEAARYAALGRMLRRAILDGWERWEETLALFGAQLATLGHDQRGGEQIGGLLAMATLVMGDELPISDEVAILCEPFDLKDKPRTETNAEQMLNWLISKTVVAFRGGNQMTIGSLVSLAAGITSNDQASTVSAAEALQAHGVFVEGDFRMECWVTLPNQSAGLAQLLDGSPWGTRPGAAISGWQQAMQRLAAQPTANGPTGKKTNSRKHGGRGWSLPVKVFLRQEEE